jgi:SAM-dependent methyltransferase
LASSGESKAFAGGLGDLLIGTTATIAVVLEFAPERLRLDSMGVETAKLVVDSTGKRGPDLDLLERFYPEVGFGGYTDVDGTIAFYLRVGALLRSNSVLLDVGSGRGRAAEDTVPVRRELRTFRGKCAKVIGIDVDPAGAENPLLDEFHLIDGERWPLSNDSVDISVCDSVVEHVEPLDAFFAELRRVTKLGGFVCIRTPNVLSYFGLASILIPNALHARTLKRTRGAEVEEQDVFPTVYRCNTRRKLRQMLRKYGFDPLVYGYESEPSYLSFSRLTYYLGVLHQRFAPDRLKVCLFAFAQKRTA